MATGYASLPCPSHVRKSTTGTLKDLAVQGRQQNLLILKCLTEGDVVGLSGVSASAS
jgi:hypothetical protein